MDRHELAPIGERALDLHFDDHLRHLVHDVRAPEQLAAQIHQLGDRAAVADELHHLRADQRDRLGVIQAHAACEPLLREIASLMQRELVELVRCQMHEVTIFYSRDRRRRAATGTQGGGAACGP